MKRPQRLLVILVAAGYAPFLGGGLITDDFVHIARAEEGWSLSRLIASPDPFGFYRPVTQASFLIDTQLCGSNPVAGRAINLVLHLAVVALAFAFARRLFGRTRPALLAALAFALTPKAHPIAVLWISARGELLMAMFSLLALNAWIEWDRRGGWRLAWAAAGSYVLALLSKETAALLPLLLLATPSSRPRLSRRRVGLALTLFAAGSLLVVARANVDAVMPDSDDPHYTLATPVQRWARNTRNYFWRALPAPAALIAVGVLSSLLALKRKGWPLDIARGSLDSLANVSGYAVAWFIVFLLPVIPVVARSELYLYLPCLGLCLLAAALVDALAKVAGWSTPVFVGLSVYTAILGGYQISRSAAWHGDLVFSAAFVDAASRSHAVAPYRGHLAVVPDDGSTERYLRDSIGGYLDIVLKRALSRSDISGSVMSTGVHAIPGARRIGCRYVDGRVHLTPEM